jgi:uncharacterized protein YbaP (TraB family)
MRMLLALSCAGLAWATAALGQERPSAPSEPTDVEGVVVTARRIGVPVWRVTNGASTVVLIGQIQGVPAKAAWRPEELERAVAQADAVLFPHDIRGTPADVARLLWRARSIVLLPKGKTLADYLDASTLARLTALAKDEAQREKRMRLHPWVVASDLMEGAEVGEPLDGDRVSQVVERAARKNRKKQEAVGAVAAGGLLDAYFEGPQAHVGCLEAAIATGEAGPEAGRRRLADWSRSRVPAVAASAAEQAHDRCWPFGPARERLRAEWRKAIDGRLAAPGVTVAVAPLLYLAEDGGLLDGLAARGLQIEGPRWRAVAGPDGE